MATSVLLAALSCLLLSCRCAATAATPPALPSILVVGSLNVDIIIKLGRLPSAGETITASEPAAATAVGGKGANQAVAAARLSEGTSRAVRFVCRFGNDSYAATLERELKGSGVDVSGCAHVGLPSGQGVVLLQPDGTATSVVLGGANTAFEQVDFVTLAHLMRGTGAVLLQREVPEHVNEAVAAAAKAAGVPVLLDVGGEDRPMSNSLLSLLDYLCPNESELGRLTGLPTATEEGVLAAAMSLIARGASNVLVTLAERGSVLVGADGKVLRQGPLPVPGGAVVDATAAGDAFRAAFAVALVEGHPLQECMRFAAAAGALAVSRMGAMPSLPHREEARRLAEGGSSGSDGSGEGPSAAEGGSTPPAAVASAAKRTNAGGDSSSSKGPGAEQGGSSPPAAAALAAAEGANAKGGASGCLSASDKSQEQSKDKGSCPASGYLAEPSQQQGQGQGQLPPTECPYQFASRLNSMRARRDLAGPGDGADTVLGWIKRQGRVRGLSLVDLNHPQHTQEHTVAQLKGALAEAGLSAGAVCMRFPEGEYALGAFSNPDKGVRERAVQLAAEGCRWAQELGARDLIVWPQFDGYDYHFQADYQAAWSHTVQAFQQVSDACTQGVRVSLEFKPTDEATRYSIVPSTGAALLLARDVGRSNFGLTLDVGHLLMAGENPAQSLALTAREGRLFGLQLNDAHVKLGAEDGLAFGAVNPVGALELVRWLQKSGFEGHLYFDTFPRKEDPIREAEYNIRRFKAFWARAARLAGAGIDALSSHHDAMAVLELLETEEAGASAAGDKGAAAMTAAAVEK